MIIHKILRGENPGLYLPFGLSRLRYFSELAGPDGYFTEKYLLDGYTIEVQQAPPFQYVRINQEESLYFEFFTSGRPISTATQSQGGITGETYRAAVVGAKLSLANGELNLSPSIRGGKRYDFAGDASAVKRPMQVNMTDENYNLIKPFGRKSGRDTYPRALYESFAPIHPYTGVFLRSYTSGSAQSLSNRGNIEAHARRDIGYDVPYQDGNKLSQVREAVLTGDADWPRANGLQTVTSATFGSREFAVYVDAFSQFSVFPTSKITTLSGLTQNVDPSFVKMVKPTLPAWVTQMPVKMKDFYDSSGGGDGILDFPEIDWKLHPDGTQACAIVLERTEATYDAAFFADSPSGAPFEEADFEAYRDSGTGVASRYGISISPTYLPQRYFYAPGLVTVAVNITITGPNAEDFDVALVVATIRRPTESAYCGMVAGYAWYDMDGIASPGDLCVLDIERYYDPATGGTQSFFSLKNLTAATEIGTYLGNRLLDYDMPTLSFVFQLHGTEVVSRTIPARSGAPFPIGTVSRDYNVVHPCAVVWTQAQFREALFPESMAPATIAFLQSIADTDARTLYTDATPGLVFMPLNDLRDWTDPDLAGLRNWYSIVQMGARTGLSVTPTDAVLNWWTASGAYLPAIGSFYVTTPRFAWNMYSDEIINRLACSSHSTFFVHPGGSWAFFDQGTIYNAYGGRAVSLDGDHDFLTPFDASLLEHVIYDRIHLELDTTTGRRSKDTSFIELYNSAVTSGINAGSLTDTFTTISRANIRATFTKETYTHTDGTAWLQLRVDWYGGYTGYFFDMDYQGGIYTTGGVIEGLTGGGGLLDLTLTGLFFTAPAYAGAISPPEHDNFPVRFCSCLLVQ